KRKGKQRLSGYFTLSIAGKIAFTIEVRRIAALHGVWHGGCISMGIMFGLQRNAPPQHPDEQKARPVLHPAGLTRSGRIRRA
ncbi:hypothetical protein, partial [Erythrobacter sp. HI0028]|uniref:hypothetical protein n=2 Tax=unclassified Erythrobacter TaxID=2633097 RepID=UPI001F302C2A